MTLSLEILRREGRPALARALALIERKPHDDVVVALLDAAYADPLGVAIGLTGPPGVGKSSLLDALVSGLRVRGLTVGVIAVDPSSVRTGGALLGDRARLALSDPADDGVFVRSMAARGRLGGLADLVFPAMTLMRALYDIVLVETVGVGQSETEVAGVTDRTVLCVQPASGDSLQFLKAGIMEIPDCIVVTKADLGSAARRAMAEVRSALTTTDDGNTMLHLLSVRSGEGVMEVLDWFESIGKTGDHELSRKNAALQWISDAIRIRYGGETSRRIPRAMLREMDQPFEMQRLIDHKMMVLLDALDFS